MAAPHSYVRRLPGGCIGTNPSTVDANCTNTALVRDTFEPTAVHPQDTDNNRDDFIFVDAQGTDLNTEGGQQRRLGAPGPQNSTSPIDRTASFKIDTIFKSVCPECPPSQLRTLPGPTPPPNQAQGTLDIRRRIDYGESDAR